MRNHSPVASSVARALILLACVALLTAIARAEIIEQVLVKVNGEIFTKTDLEARQVARLREQGQRIDLKTNAGNAQLQKLLDQITPADHGGCDQRNPRGPAGEGARLQA